MNLKHLAYFVAVADQLHFTRAAQELGIAQPALSQAVHRLESKLGVSLLDRSSRSVALTDFGHALLPRARRLISLANLSERELKEMAGLQKPKLRVGASGTIAAFMLPEILRDYRRQRPKTVLEIVQRRTEGVLALVEAGDLDVGLVRLPFRATDLTITPLTVEPLFAALPPEHAMAAAKSLSMSALQYDPFIMCVRESEPFYDVVLNLCAERGFVPNVISAGAEYTTVFRLVAMGMGVSIVSEAATKHLVHPRPAFVRVADAKATSPIVSVTQSHAQLSLAARDLLAIAQALVTLETATSEQPSAAAAS